MLLLQALLLLLVNVPWLKVGLERVEEEGGGRRRWKKLLVEGRKGGGGLYVGCVLGEMGK